MLKKNVVLGMSGGVDSSVCALILKEQGFNVIGVFMKNWDEKNDTVCTATDDYLDVVRVCEQIGIKYYTVNFEKEYNDKVFSYFLSEYEKGRTPNPDVLCNSEIKFNAFLKFALKLDCDYIAMGHYARTSLINDKVYLLKGKDINKDQSYFLSRVPKEALAKTIFPLGDMEKSDVRKFAEKYNLSTKNKKDSTGICFIGERNFNEFLDKFLYIKEGDIYSIDGQCLGKHSGLIHYTIGQRKGIGIGGVGNGEPFFVVDKDLVNNRLIVAQGINNPALYRNDFICENPFWINDDLKFPLQCTGKIRYRAKDEEMIVKKENNLLHVQLKNPLKGITPGQVCVFYQNEICLGSGIIQ